MQKTLVYLSLMIALVTGIAEGYPSEGAIEVGGGYREDRVRWTVTSDLFPNFESTSYWRDIHIAQTTATAHYTNGYNYKFWGMARYGEIYQGKQTHKELFNLPEDARFEEITLLKSSNNSNQGEVYDLSGGLGYTFHFLCDRARITPSVGYSYHVQNFHMHNLEIDINNIDGIIGSIPGIHSSYHTRWKGPWVGADLILTMMCNWDIFGRAEYHWAHFRGKGHFHLRTELLDGIKQHGDGRGLVYNLGVRYWITKAFSLSLQGDYQAWRTWNGSDEKFVGNFEIESDLNVAHWHTWSANLALEYWW